MAPAAAAWVTTSAMSGVETMEASSIRTRSPGRSSTAPRAPRWPGRWPRNWAVLYDTGTPAARVLRADWDGVMPITRPSPAAAHARPAAASTHVFPDPAGALITDTRRSSVSTASAAAA